MIAVIDSPRPFSHVLLMDDDVLVHPDALLRTYRLLRLMKPEYAGKTIAGAMLRLDDRWMQHECCARWNGRFAESGKHGLDLRRIGDVLGNETEEPFDYNAWWYSCIPMSRISNHSLPVPMFVRMDDVEFGLRTGSDILSLNGVCLWHEPFEYKFSSAMDYYEIRNLMLLNALRRPDLSWRAAAARMMYRILANLVRYRYKDCELVLRGAEDFLAGADAWLRRDPEALHRRVLADSDQFVPVEQLEIPFDEAVYRRNLERKKGGLHAVRLVFLNGLFLPPKPPTIVDAFSAVPWACYRRKALLNYHAPSGRGFVTRRSVRKSLSFVFRGLTMSVRLMRRYAGAAQSYREAEPTLVSRDFWDAYLGLK